MPIETTLLDIPLGQGLAEALDPRVLPLGASARLENYEANLAGALTRRRSLVRQGWTSPGTFGRLIGRGDQLHQVAGVGSPPTWSLVHKRKSDTEWTTLSQVSPCSVRRRSLMRPAGNTQGASLAPMAYGRDFVVVRSTTATTTTHVWRIVDRATGTIVVPDVTLSADAVGTPPMAAPNTDGTVWLACGYSGSLIMRRIDVLGTVLQTITVVTVGTSSFVFDLVRSEATGEVLLAYGLYPVASPAISSRAITLARFNDTGNVGAPTAVRSGQGALQCVAVSGGASGIHLAWTELQFAGAGPPVTYDVPKHWLATYNSTTFAVLMAPVNVTSSDPQAVSGVPWFNLACGVCQDDNSKIIVAYDQFIVGTLGGFRVWSGGVPFPGGGGAAFFHLAVRDRLASGLRYIDGVGVVAVLWVPETGNTLDPTGAEHLALVSLTGSVSTVPPLLAHLASVTGGRQSQAHIYATDGDQYTLAVGAVQWKNQGFAQRLEGADRIDLDFRQRQSALHHWADTPPTWLLGGGLVQVVDGTRVVEASFLQAPSLNLSVSASTGAMRASPAPGDTYLYRARYEATDDAGTVHVGPWSQDVTITLTNGTVVLNKAVDLVLGCTSLSLRDNTTSPIRSVRIAVYRSLSNGASAGGDVPLYRLDDPTRQIATSTANNLASVFAVQVTDGYGDTDLVARRFGVVLTTGDVLAAIAPPPSADICVHRDRAWVASAEDGASLYASRLLVPGEPPTFAQELVLRLTDAPDRLVAIESMDDKLIAYTPTRIYQVVGDGPADNGLGGGWNVYNIQARQGCADARSLVVIPDGHVYLSASGFCLLTRGLEVQPIGESVRQTLASYAYCIDSHHDATRRRAVWLMAQGPSGFSDSILVVYDYLHGAWSTVTGSSTVNAAGSVALWSGQVLTTLSDSDYYLEVYGQADGPVAAPLWAPGVYETPWIAPGGLGATHRVRQLFLLGQVLTACRALVEVFVDFGTEPVQSQLVKLDNSDPDGFKGLPLVRYRLPMKVQQVEAIKIRISDSGPFTALGFADRPGLALTRLALEIGQDPGMPRLPATNRGGT